MYKRRSKNIKTVIGVPGIHEGRKSATDKALAQLKLYGFHTEDPELALRWAITARFFVNRDARQVLNALRDGDALFCHSYGCLRGTRAAEMAYQKNGEIVRLLFLVAPAMEVDYDFSKLSPLTRVVCLHSSEDDAIKWGARMRFSPFGDAGRKGFEDIGRVSHIDCYPNGHSSYFERAQLPRWIKEFDTAFHMLPETFHIPTQPNWKKIPTTNSEA